MFGFGNKLQKLEKLYQKLLQESYELSHTDRKRSDLKAAEAEAVRKQIDELDSKQAGVD